MGEDRNDEFQLSGEMKRNITIGGSIGCVAATLGFIALVAITTAVVALVVKWIG